MKKKKILGVGVKSTTKNSITFKTEAKAKKFLAQMKSIHSKYSRTNYGRKGKTVYRY